MKSYTGISEYTSEFPSILTIGTFDGVHIGHQRIIQRLIEEAHRLRGNSVVLTFYPHPRSVLQADSRIQLLNTMDEKTDILAGLGLDALVVHPFTLEFSRLTAQEFVQDLLVDRLNVRKIIIGYDHRFGRNRNANITDLIAFGQAYDFEVEEIPAQAIEEVSVSSTKIRKALAEGDVARAREFLGYPYLLSGEVVRGMGRGRDFGFPTANLRVIQEDKLVPARGVYVVSGEIDHRWHFGMMNIGTNPTFDQRNTSMEVHFFDCDSDLYGRELRVFFWERLRDERRFDSAQELVRQLQVDRERSMELIAQLPLTPPL